MSRGLLERLLSQTQTGSVPPRTAGLYLQKSWDPLRLHRGALTWFRCRNICRQGCCLDYWEAVLWSEAECVCQLVDGNDTNRKSFLHSLWHDQVYIIRTLSNEQTDKEKNLP